MKDKDSKAPDPYVDQLAALHAQREQVTSKRAKVAGAAAAAEATAARKEAEREPLLVGALADGDADAATTAAQLAADADTAARRGRDCRTVEAQLATQLAEVERTIARVERDQRIGALRAQRTTVEAHAGAVDAAMATLKTLLAEHLELCAALQVEGEALGVRNWSRVGETLRLRLYTLMALREVFPDLDADPTFDRFFHRNLVALEADFKVPENPQLPDPHPTGAQPVPATLAPKKRAAA